MHSRKDAEFQDDAMPFAVFDEEDDSETAAEIEAVLGTNGERRSWKKICAAKRSIERYRERQHLKFLLTEAFDEGWDELEAAQISLPDLLDDD